jgi:hypothetical protein
MATNRATPAGHPSYDHVALSLHLTAVLWLWLSVHPAAGAAYLVLGRPDDHVDAHLRRPAR